MKLPLLLSVPHAGLRIPPEVESWCILAHEDVVKDGDEGAAEIFALGKCVKAWITTDIARAIIDLNRAEDDRRQDGVVKTHTCWDVPVYEPFPPENVVQELLERYHRPYHRKLTRLARTGVRLGIDCHTMAGIAPPVAPDKGQRRPAVCLSNGDGITCPDPWFRQLGECFRNVFADFPVWLNTPFKGGYLTRTHAREMPWVQLEISRAPFLSPGETRKRVLQALTDWCTWALPGT